MEAKFTPGPWRLHDYPYLHIRAGGSDGENDGATVFAGDYAGPGGVNAHLIAAAPDLYEALKAVLERFDPMATPGTDANLAAVSLAVHALSKALGKQEG